MAQVYYDSYHFPSLEQIPAIDTLRQKISTLLGGEEKILDGKTSDISVGASPQVRTFVRFQVGQTEITLIHDSPTLIIEVNVVGPIQNLYRIDTLLISLGARPRFGQKSWQATIRARTWAKIRKALITLLLLTAAIYIIYRWTWLGLIAVVLFTAAIAFLYIVMLAKSFKR